MPSRNDDDLARLLDAAAAPGHAHETRGSEDALRALRVAQQGTVRTAPTRRGRMRARVVAATLTTKLAIIAVVAVAAAGTALAGATGHLPGQHRAPQPRNVTTTHPAPPSKSSTRSRSSSSEPTHSSSTARPSSTAPSTSPTTSGTTSPRTKPPTTSTTRVSPSRSPTKHPPSTPATHTSAR